MLLPISPFLARAGQSFVFLQFVVWFLWNSGGLGPGEGSSPELCRAGENWDLWGFSGKERCCQGPFPKAWSPGQSFQGGDAHRQSCSISLLPGSYVLPSRLKARDKTSCLPLSKEAEPLLGKSGGGGVFSTLGPPAGWSRGSWGGGWGLPSSSFPRLAGKVSIETAALASPEIWGKTDSKKSHLRFWGRAA